MLISSEAGITHVTQDTVFYASHESWRASVSIEETWEDIMTLKG